LKLLNLTSKDAIDGVLVNFGCFVFPFTTPEEAADGGDGGRRRLVADSLFDEALADLPAEDAGGVALVEVDAALDLRGGDARLAAPDHPRPDRARLLVAVQDLGDAAVRDAQLARDDARTHASRRQLDDLESDVVGQWSSVDEHAAQLVHPPLTYTNTDANRQIS